MLGLYIVLVSSKRLCELSLQGDTQLQLSLSFLPLDKAQTGGEITCYQQIS